MQIQFGEVVRNQSQRFFPALGPVALGQRNFGLNLAAGFRQGLRQQSDILMRPFDAVKRRFRFVAHSHAFPPGTGISLNFGSNPSIFA